MTAVNTNSTRTVIVEIKYINSKNTSIHSENCKLDIPLNISASVLSKTICHMAGIMESSKKRGFADYAIEMFYIDFIEQGQPKKAPFVLRTDDQLAMFVKSECKSLSVRVIQRIVSFEKGTLNILLEKDEKSSKSNETNDNAGSGQSSKSSNRTSNGGDLKESTETIITKKGKKGSRNYGNKVNKGGCNIERLKELLLQTDNARLSEDGKSIVCLLCGKSPKVDRCKRSAEGHIKYFNRVHSCSTKTTKPDTLKTKRIEEFFEPAVKRKRLNSNDDAEPIGTVAQPQDSQDSPTENDE